MLDSRPANFFWATALFLSKPNLFQSFFFIIDKILNFANS